MKIIDYPDRDALVVDVANAFVGELETCLFNHDHASFVVPGGSTPGPIFDVLCAADLDWARVHVSLTDERWVDETHARSNAAQVRARLLQDRAAKAQFVPLYHSGLSPEDGAAAAAEALAPELPVSLLMLGMGDDMHTASLFPGDPGLAKGLAPDAPNVVAVHPVGQEPRVSLSSKVLNGAMSKHLVIFGQPKRNALETAQTLTPQEAPIAAVMADLTVHFAE